MKTQLPAKIETLNQVHAFIADLIANDEAYHFDDDPHDIESINSDAADKLEVLMAQCFAIVDVWSIVEVNGFLGIRMRQTDDTEALLSFIAPQMFELLKLSLNIEAMTAEQKDQHHLKIMELINSVTL